VRSTVVGIDSARCSSGMGTGTWHATQICLGLPQLSHPQPQPMAIYWRRVGFRFLYPRQVQKAAFKNLQPLWQYFVRVCVKFCCTYFCLTFLFHFSSFLSPLLFSHFSFLSFFIYIYFFCMCLRLILSMYLRRIPEKYK
jgi:hypothetical protein